MISKYKIRVIVLIVGGIVLKLLGTVALVIGTEFLFWSSLFLIFAGWISFLVGCMYYAEIKGYHGVIGLLLGIFLNLLGVLILLLLPKRPEKIEEEKISRFFPKGKKEKILLILVVAILLVILGVIGKQVVGLRGIGQEYEEAKKTIEEFRQLIKEEEKDERVITRMEGIQEELLKMLVEAHFGPDVYIDVSCGHPRIKSFCEGIENQVGVKPTIHSTPNRYCAYIKLPSGKYNCIDSVFQDFSVTMTENPSSPGRCDGITFVCQEEKEEKTDTGINITSPAEEEKWKEGEMYSIIWEQWGLTGKEIKICLIGKDSAQQPLSAEWIYRKDCSDMGGYQIGEAIFAENGKYNWKIPNNLSDKFLGTPVSYYIKIHPLERILQLGLSIKYGMTDDFEISK